ncbi:hypothetical protein ES288_D10G223800v1 [Gossypium darwinii]|uniref:Uncharacterized protein n=1 Tax=Gossypium darwinii TaxID=34276 RepID=A0A5D2B1B7_GOSDA|nr:hypothetical protein ES288_D10G223800v1 [Gossypium darwinii]
MANSLHLLRLIIPRYLFLELCTKPQIEKVYSSFLELKLEDVDPVYQGPRGKSFPDIKIGTFCNMKNCLISNIPNVACLNLTTLLRAA